MCANARERSFSQILHRLHMSETFRIDFRCEPPMIDRQNANIQSHHRTVHKVHIEASIEGIPQSWR